MSYYNSIPQTVSAPFSDPPDAPLQPGGKRRKISTACSACQHRKTRCSGGVPCTACVGRGSPCLYDAASDQRRKVAVHRNLQDLSQTKALLDKTQQALGGLIAVMRAGNEQTIRNLILVIQSGVDLSQIAAHIRNAVRSDQTIQSIYDEMNYEIDGSHDLPSAAAILSTSPSSESPPEISSAYNETVLARPPPISNSSSESIRGSAHARVEPPIRVPAKPWTNVTDDDYLVSHLISIWLAWMHPWWQWIDKDTFVEAMQKKDISSPLCTACIVNMILADACLLDVGVGDNKARMEFSQRFYQEGMKCMQDINERPGSLGFISALGVQWTYLNTIGDDKSGLKVLEEQLDKAEELDDWRRNLRLPPQILRKVDICLDRLAWTLYTLKGLSLMSFQQLQPPSIPDRPKPVRDCIKDQRHDHNPHQPWPLYPSTVSRNFHYECHYSCFISLAETICRDEALLGATGLGDREADATFEESFRKLEDWPNHLPDCMQLTEQATPHVLALHAVHLWASINLVKQANASAKGRLSQPELMESSVDPRSRWTIVAYRAAVRISELLMTHSWLWGVEYFPVILVQPISLALFVLLGDLNSQTHATAFTNLCFWTYSVSRRLKVARGILALVEKKIRELGITVPREAQEYFVSQPSDSTDKPQADVEYLLGKWDDFDLGS